MNTEKTVISEENRLETAAAPKYSRAGEFWTVFKKNRLAVTGLIIFILFFTAALAGLVLTSGQNPIFDPARIRLQEKLRPPLSRVNFDVLQPAETPFLNVYLFGTDELGRDVFARMLQGAWVSLTVGFVAVGIAVFIGIFMGGIAGYFGQTLLKLRHVLAGILLITGIALAIIGWWVLGILCLVAGGGLYFWHNRTIKNSEGDTTRPDTRLIDLPVFSVDTLIMRLVDIMICFPSFFLILTVVALLPASIYNIMIVIGLTGWMGATRFIRAEFLSLRELDFVAAARALGVGNLRIIFRHMMPNAIAPVLVSATIGIASAILTEAGLSFLGFGVPPPHATWGNILSDGKRFIFDAPWLTFIPGTAVLIVVLSFNLFGEGLREALNPKLRGRR